MPVRACLAALLLICAGCAKTGASDEAGAHQAHDAYLAAINSNDLETFLGMLADDVVLMAAHDKPIVGKAAVRPWAESYYAAYTTEWTKTLDELVVNGDWAFERYGYKVVDTPKDGAPAIEDTGWGLLVYHHDADGQWRVARDAWGPDHPASAPPVAQAP